LEKLKEIQMRYMMRGSVVAVALCVYSTLAVAQQQENLRTISTNGEAIVYVMPDEAIVNFGVQTTHNELDRSKAANDEAAKRLVKAVKAMGIEDKYLATDNVQVELQYQDQGRVISAYIVTRMYMVTLKDVKKLEALVDTVLKNGATLLQGVEFRSTELRKHRDNARSMAIKAAREKAVALARDVECSVGAPRTVNESGGVWYGYGNLGNRFSYAQNAVQDMGGGGGEGGETLPLGQMAIRANVSVTFDLVPGGK
jgi:uncharacterized protein YggE